MDKSISYGSKVDVFSEHGMLLSMADVIEFPNINGNGDYWLLKTNTIHIVKNYTMISLVIEREESNSESEYPLPF
jgi:hypothetical protein